MSNIKRLTSKQQAVIDELFTGNQGQQQILEKHKVSDRLYEEWLADETFVKEFNRRLDSARLQSELFIARFAPNAVAKLIELLDSKNHETARKACLNIITLLRSDKSRKSNTEAPAGNDATAELPPEVASRLLSALTSQGPLRSKGNK